jgi:hypothetical protein
MSSISPKQHKLLVRFFRKYLLPLAGQPLVFEKSVCQTASESQDNENSYYVRKNRPALRPDEFELKMGEKKEIQKTLENYWAGKSFAGLAGPLMKLTAEFENQKEKDEVSSSVYEMF